MPTLSEILTGVAVGDAIGNPWEFSKRGHTPSEVLSSSRKGPLVVSDDTQMSLFCAESLSLAAAHSSIDALVASLTAGYLRWYFTQQVRYSPKYSFGLLRFASLYDRQAPGMTCMASLRTLHTGKEVSNNSKGNGTVMRCAPIAVWAKAKRISPTSAQLLSRRDAEITHKHPYAAESSSLLVGIYLRLFSGTPFRVAVALEVQSQVEAGLVSWPVAALCLAAVDPCLNFSEFSTRHTSFIAEGTLAVALAAVAKSASFLEAVVLAASTPGDSDTIAAVAGGLAVAVGYKVPAKYSSRLNVAPVLDYMEKTYQ